MKYTWRYTEQALRDLSEIDKATRALILKKIPVYCAAPNPLSFAKPLHGSLRGLFRFRIGDYRAIFRIMPSGQITLLLILNIKNRKEVYD